MQNFVIILLAYFFGLTGTPAGVGPRDGDSSPRRDLTTMEARAAISLIFEGKTDRSVTLIDSLAAPCGGEPLYLFVKSRVYRELLTVDDENKAQVKLDSQPLLADLDRLIGVCNERMEAGQNDPDLLLYRGLAWMVKSHVRSFGRSFWSAGRDAKKGKKDLEDYLERFPENNLARGTLGAFYYFADMIPGMFKFLSRLVLLPTGDREKGLLYISQAAAGESLFKTDFEMLLYTIFVLFEGRYEEGLEGIRALWDRYPRYERLGAPTLLLRPFIPMSRPGDDARIEALIGPRPGDPGDPTTRQEVNLLRFLRAYSDRFYQSPTLAAAGLRVVSDADADHPDWASGFAAIELARLQASHGRIDLAHPLLVEVGSAGSLDYLRGLARETLADLDGNPAESGVVDETWAGKVYRGSSADRRGVIAALREVDHTPLQAAFYLGDALLLEGDLERALDVFENILERDVPRWGREYRMIAAARVAEIHGAGGAYDKAAASLSRALDCYDKEYLLDWILEGRRAYYQRLVEGKEKAAPSFFSAAR